MKHDPISICTSMWLRSFSLPTPPTPTPTNLSGYLKSFDLLILSYRLSSAHLHGLLPSLSSLSPKTLRSLLLLRSSLLSRRFRWNSRSAHPLFESLPHSNRKRRQFESSPDPLFQDRIVQELLLLILEPVFEPRFSPRSHAFRPGRNAHTLLRTVRTNFAGLLWFVKVDLTRVVDGLDAKTVMGLVEKGVADRNVLGLLRSALRAPSPKAREAEEVYEAGDKGSAIRARKKKKKKSKKLRRDEPKPDPYWLRTFDGLAPEEAIHVPNYGHCGILSPLIANVCLTELDEWLEQQMSGYSPHHRHHNPTWPEFVPTSSALGAKRMDYVRYGSYVLIGIRGSRGDAVELREKMMDFCECKYRSRPERPDFEIEHVVRGIEFLDHIIRQRIVHPTLRYTGSGGKIVSEKGVGTLLSVTASLPRCIARLRRLELVKGDRNPEPLPCVPMLYSGQAHTNAQMNKLLEAIADWYRYADNRKTVVGFCAYVIRSSVAKLYAARYRLKSRAKVYRIASRDLSRPLRESSGVAEYTDLLRMGLVDRIDGLQFSRLSEVPPCDYTLFPRDWVPHHERLLREYTKLQDPKFFYELYKSVKREEGLRLPQEEVSRIVWDLKVFGVRRGAQSSRRFTRQPESMSENGSDTKDSVNG
ncbi:hypothetical protein QJS10_CPB14g00459 [Acorus calamus]|uniref:Domain X domain-containing protein n=1 Tax=Acorus calamus TaxID=4465 RepID=A0AAV9DAT4_ACOCL|nr:hypothetical protein QJS10_CPB14g00459 [Acorus calamus]